jgi:hypothetical protein
MRKACQVSVEGTASIYLLDYIGFFKSDPQRIARIFSGETALLNEPFNPVEQNDQGCRGICQGSGIDMKESSLYSKFGDVIKP